MCAVCKRLALIVCKACIYTDITKHECVINLPIKGIYFALTELLVNKCSQRE